MKYSVVIFYIFIYLNFIIIKTHGEVEIELTMPVFKEDYSKIETLLLENMGDLSSDFQILSEDTLNKPLITSAFSNINSINRGSLSLLSITNMDFYSFYLGSSLGVYLENLDIDSLTSTLESITPELDYSVGFTGDLLIIGLTIPNFSLNFWYSNIDIDDYFFNSLGFSLGYSKSFINGLGRRNIFIWNPLKLGSSLSLGYNNLGVLLHPGLITQNFSFDPDDEGPLLPLGVDIEVDPEIKLSLETYSGAFTILAATGIELFNLFYINGGGGFNLQIGRSDILIESTQDIVVKGYLSNFIETPPRISINGSLSPQYSDLFMAFIFGNIQINISSIFINISGLYNFPNGLCAGLSFGVKY